MELNGIELNRKRELTPWEAMAVCPLPLLFLFHSLLRTSCSLPLPPMPAHVSVCLCVMKRQPAANVSINNKHDNNNEVAQHLLNGKKKTGQMAENYKANECASQQITFIINQL